MRAGDSSRCGHEWDAPLMLASGRFERMRKECVLPAGHPIDQDHRSLDGVTTPNTGIIRTSRVIPSPYFGPPPTFVPSPWPSR